MDFQINEIGSKIEIITPYHPAYVKLIKQTCAQWNGTGWVTDKRNIDVVREIMREVYGRDDTPIPSSDLVTVRLTFPDGCSKWRGAVCACGHVIASAFGRDSGAKIGSDVCFSRGGATSGGSVKNWQTIIYSGSVCLIYDVPRSIAVEAHMPDGIKFEVIEQGSNSDRKNSLLEEKKELEVKLARVNAELEYITICNSEHNN